MISLLQVSAAQQERVKRAEDEHQDLLRQFEKQLRTFNKRHNLISCDAEKHIYDHHILHCLAIASMDFQSGTTVVDWGSGGGLPAIPIAITNPTVLVTAVDKIGKKIQAVSSIGKRLNLPNLTAFHARAESWEGTAHYSVSRATASLKTLWDWHGNMSANRTDKSDESLVPGSASEQPELGWKPGLICLKGGNLDIEIEQLVESDTSVVISAYNIEDLLGNRRGGAYFENKYLLHITSGRVDG
jgi:16S rRNA (guanine527-N7)-methyltransferase